ncbi:MAG: hypothetical protein AB7E60_07015 [Sphingobium sp.]
MKNLSAILSRRALLASLGSTAFFIPARALAQAPNIDTILRNLTWDRARREKLWRQAGGAPFQLIYGRPFHQGKSAYAPSPSMDYNVIRDATEALRQASAFYFQRNLPAPHLPVGPDIGGGSGDRFYIVFVDDTPGANGIVASGYQPNSGLREHSGIGIEKEVARAINNIRENVTGAGAHPVSFGVHMVISHDSYTNPPRDAPWAGQNTLAHELKHAISGTGAKLARLPAEARQRDPLRHEPHVRSARGASHCYGDG